MLFSGSTLESISREWTEIDQRFKSEISFNGNVIYVISGQGIHCSFCFFDIRIRRFRDIKILRITSRIIKLFKVFGKGMLAEHEKHKCCQQHKKAFHPLQHLLLPIIFNIIEENEVKINYAVFVRTVVRICKTCN